MAVAWRRGPGAFATLIPCIGLETGLPFSVTTPSTLIHRPAVVAMSTKRNGSHIRAHSHRAPCSRPRQRHINLLPAILNQGSLQEEMVIHLRSFQLRLPPHSKMAWLPRHRFSTTTVDL